MKKIPTIAISTARSVGLKKSSGRIATRSQYAQSLYQNGAYPVLIPILDGLDEEYYDYVVNAFDALLLTGGGDINPILYTEKISSTSGNFLPNAPMEIDDGRDNVELALLKHFWEAKKPIVGICRGMQLINVFFGGSLNQDLSQVVGDKNAHFNPKGEEALDAYYHEIKISKNSNLINIIGKDSISVNSFHHQGVDRLGEELYISAKSEDGVIEAIETTKKGQFCLGFQWHPEQIDDENSRSIFSEFIRQM